MVLGVVGLFAPILQGWLFIIAGLSVMAPESPTAHRSLEWLKARLPGRKHRQDAEPAAEAADARHAPRAPHEQPTEHSVAAGGRGQRLGTNEGGHG